MSFVSKKYCQIVEFVKIKEHSTIYCYHTFASVQLGSLKCPKMSSSEVVFNTLAVFTWVKKYVLTLIASRLNPVEHFCLFLEEEG